MIKSMTGFGRCELAEEGSVDGFVKKILKQLGKSYGGELRS